MWFRKGKVLFNYILIRFALEKKLKLQKTISSGVTALKLTKNSRVRMSNYSVDVQETSDTEWVTWLVVDVLIFESWMFNRKSSIETNKFAKFTSLVREPARVPETAHLDIYIIRVNFYPILFSTAVWIKRKMSIHFAHCVHFRSLVENESDICRC